VGQASPSRASATLAPGAPRGGHHIEARTIGDGAAGHRVEAEPKRLLLDMRQRPDFEQHGTHLRRRIGPRGVFHDLQDALGK